MAKNKDIRSIYMMYEPNLFKLMSRRGCDDFNVFNLEFAKCYYFNTLYTMAVSLPTWEGLDPSIKKDIMERILINNGSVVLHYDEALEKYVTLVLGTIKKWDNDGRPLLFDATTLFGRITYHNLTPDNAVVIYDSITQIPTIATIDFFAGRLANARLTIDQCIRNLKVPYIIRTTSDNKAAVEAIMKEIYTFKPAIIEDGIVDLECLKAYTLTDNLPESLEAARNEFSRLYSEAQTAIGVNVGDTDDKKERMTTFEIAKSLSNSIMAQEARLKPRITGAEEINRVFANTSKPMTDVKVSFTRILTPIDGVSDESEWSDLDVSVKEGEVNEQVHT